MPVWIISCVNKYSTRAHRLPYYSALPLDGVDACAHDVIRPMEINLCVDIAFIGIITFQQRLFSMDRVHMDL